jgi:hypothetical protein
MVFCLFGFLFERLLSASNQLPELLHAQCHGEGGKPFLQEAAVAVVLTSDRLGQHS